MIPEWETKDWDAGHSPEPLDPEEQATANELWKVVRWLAEYRQWGNAFDPQPWLERDPESDTEFVRDDMPPCTWEHSIGVLHIEQHREFWSVQLRSVEASSNWSGEGRGRTLAEALKDLVDHAG